MEKFTQKWAIVSLLQNVPDGSLFYYTDFPLHVTLAGVFSINKSGSDIIHEIQQLTIDQPSFEIEGDEKDMFGPDRNIAVMKIKRSQELLELHSKIHERLVALGAVYNSPEYQGAGYVAHSTFQRSGKLNTGEKRRISSVSLIDLFPNGDGYQRKVFKSIRLK